ncbi:MAG TPA: M48 family metalloprotease [Beijerinckiaceae bacterium]|nr:M48 family metalloprotease [Beijerinckiaceae bacterium]
MSGTWRIGAAALALALGGCVGDPGPTAALPPELPRVVGQTTPDEHRQLVAAFGGEVRAPEAERLLAEVAQRLAPATERPNETFRVTILDSAALNAFALPSGRLYVTRGLLALANDTAEIAAVLAHEIAHVTLRHATSRSELALRSKLVSRVVADVLNDPAGGAALEDRSRFTLASFSRGQELEADQVGVRTLAKAGYDPYGAARFLTSLDRSGSFARAGGTAQGSDMLATHPSTPERLALVQQAARRIGAPGIGEGDRARYLSAIEGLAFGDNPADGLVRGRRYVHARLGITFEAPEGLALESNARAVIGISADGGRRFLFDAIEVEAGRSLEEVLRSTWNDEIETASVQSTTVNGLPAATASSRGGEWAFRLAAVRIGDATFRMIMAQRSARGLDAAFRGALDSLRRLAPDDMAALRPLRVALVTAAEGDTPERLAARMATDRPLERFLLMNGLERGARLRPGELYKIVAE